MNGITRASALLDSSTQHYFRDYALIGTVLLTFIIFGTLLWRRYR
jgi:hypothetical protein